MSTRSYADAINCLNTLQSNASALRSAVAITPQQQQSNYAKKLDLVTEYLARIGYAPHELNALNVIHITGTKGKGSTCAMVDSILRHAKPSWTIGLYTSPHLVAVRERIRINGSPISEEDFATYFFQVWDKLGANTSRRDEDTPLRPMYFRFLTILAFHIFLTLKVDATVLEVGIGGLHDDTNIVPSPIVTGVSSIGYDHMSILGNTIQEIAYQKGGIFKAGVPSYTVEQSAEALQALERQASNRQASKLEVVIPPKYLSTIPIGLEGSHQIQNAALAVSLATEFLATQSFHMTVGSADTLPECIAMGLKAARWPGRCQRLQDPQCHGLQWFLDGAHTAESLKCCMEWFVRPSGALSVNPRNPHARVLIFNCTKGRTGLVFLQKMLDIAQTRLVEYKSDEALDSFFTDVIFCTNVTYADGNFKGDLLSVNLDSNQSSLDTQQELSAAWSTLLPTFSPEHIHVLPSIEHAVTFVRALAPNHTVQTLVAGSLHLVGGLIEVAGLDFTH